MSNKLWRLNTRTIYSVKPPKLKNCIDVEYFMYIWWENRFYKHFLV